MYDMVIQNISLFTDAEMEAIKRRLHNDYSDPTSIFANRVRPKLLEIQAWHTPAMRKRLHSLLMQQRKMREVEPATPNDEQSFNEFAKEIGY